MDFSNISPDMRLKLIRDKIIESARRQSEATLAMNQLFGLLNECNVDLDSVTNAPNADNLSDAINCYINYGEYTIDRLIDEIYKAMR